MEKQKLTKTQNVNINLVDANFNLSPCGTLLILQDAATVHAEQLGCGYKVLQKAGYFWVLSKIKVDYVRPIKLYEKIKLVTWPLPPKLVFTERDFIIRDKNNAAVLRASSKWCLLKTADHSLCKTADVKDLIKLNPLNKHAIENCFYEKIVKTPNFTHSYTHTVRWTDLDANMHVNNTRYADFAINALTEAENKKGISGFEINFLSEVKNNSVINIFKLKQQNKIYIVGEVNNTPVFSALIYLAS